MRKLLASIVVSAMLGICSSSFGYFLIYNVSTTMSGIDFDTATKVSVPVKGYLVLNLTSGDELQDCNLILYGKDANTPKKNKVYVQLNSDQSSDSNYLDWDSDSSTTATGTYVFANMWTYGNFDSPFDFELLVMGKSGTKYVGTLAGNRPVVTSMKGVIMVWSDMLLDKDQDLEGTANISITLNSSFTKAFNDSGPTWTQDQIINGQDIGGKTRGIKPDLERQGYLPAEMP